MINELTVPLHMPGKGEGGWLPMREYAKAETETAAQSRQ